MYAAIFSAVSKLLSAAKRWVVSTREGGGRSADAQAKRGGSCARAVAQINTFEIVKLCYNKVVFEIYKMFLGCVIFSPLLLFSRLCVLLNFLIVQTFTLIIVLHDEMTKYPKNIIWVKKR